MKVNGQKNKASILFLIGIFLIPFTGTDYLLPLGELKTDLAAQFIVLCAVFALGNSFIKGKLIVLTNRELIPLYLFIIWVFISFVFNLGYINSFAFKGKTGIVKFVGQVFVVIMFGSIILHYFYTSIRSLDLIKLFYRIRKIVLYSFIFVFFFGLVEICWGIYKIGFFEAVYEFLSLIILKGKTQGWNLDRISSVTQEPPFLAMYLTFSSPWLFSYILTQKGVFRFLPALGIAILSYYSGSRTAMIILVFEVVVFFYYSMKSKYFKTKISNILVYICFIIGIAFILFGPIIVNSIKDKVTTITALKEDNSHHKVSNLSRFGTQEAALKIFMDNPFFGVGLGQQGFYFSDYYSNDVINGSYEIRLFMDPDEETWPPGYSLLTRLLAETGIIGCLLFFFFNLNLLFKLIQIFSKNLEREFKIVVIVSITLLVGFLLNYLQFDSFRLVGYWLSVVFSLIITSVYRNFANK